MDETLTILGDDPHYRKEAPKSWGPFQLLEMVGHGGFGEVYRAFDTVLQREVALKLLYPRLSDQADQEKAILREARLLARIRHPNVVTIYGVDTHEGRVGFWSDFVKGKTLSTLLAIQGPFSAREAAHVGIDLCKAIAAVHSAGLLHRDIKASNAMREEGGRILLVDFGLSLEARDQHHLGGTPTYMAPELFTGKGASVASDIYALGILLYHLLTAKYPVDAPTLQEIAEAHEKAPRKSLYDQRSDLPEKLVHAVETAIHKDPAQRHQSAGQMLLALSESLGAASSVHSVTGTATAPEKKRTYWGLAVPAVAVLAAAAWFSPVRQLLPFANPASSASGTASSMKAQEYLDKYYLPGNLDKAIDGFRQAIAADPKSQLAYAGLCRADFINYRAQATPELLTSTQEACEKAGKPDDLASVHVTLGMLYTLTNKNDAAEHEINTALRLAPRSAEVFAAQADLYARQGRTADVEPAYQQAETLAPQDWRWPNQLGNFYRLNGRLEDAVKQFQLAVDLTKDNSKAWNNLGIAYRRLNKLPEAKAAYNKAIELDPADNYFANLGLVLVEEGDYQEAVKLYLRAGSLNPSNYLTWANLASAYDKIPGDRALALENYRKAIDLAEQEHQRSPQDATLISNLGSYYATLNMPEKSLPLLRQAAALEPDNPQVLFRAGEGFELLHQRDEALRWIGKALEKKYSLEMLKRNPEMAALVADKRFSAIAAKSK